MQDYSATMQELNWNDLRFVLAVARCRSLAKAARQLAVNETTVARRVRKVERDLSARLFERIGGAMVATGAGERVIASAERIELEAQRLESAIAGTDPADLCRIWKPKLLLRQSDNQPPASMVA